MNHRLMRIVLVTFAAVILPTAALAASPRGGASYVGMRGGTTNLLEKVTLKVAPNGRSARGVYFCRDTRAGQRIPTFKIARGRFNVVKKLGSVKLIGLKGQFVTRDRIEAVLDVRTSCNGKNGKLTLQRKLT